MIMMRFDFSTKPMNGKRMKEKHMKIVIIIEDVEKLKIFLMIRKSKCN